MKLDTNRAWESGTRFFAANKGILAALAGIFIFVPAAIFSLVHPQPELAPEMTEVEQRALLTEWLGEAWPLGLVVTIITMIGTLAIYRLATRRDGATVKQALQQGLRAFPTYFGAQFLFNLLVGIASAAVLFVAALIGVVVGGETAAAILMFIAALPVLAYLFARGSLIAAVIMGEGEANPVVAIKRSFALTKGHTLRIIVFIVLIAIASLVVLLVVQGLLGLIFMAAAGGDTATHLSAVVFALITSVVSVLFISMFAAIYRQLSAETAPRASVPPTVGDE